MKGKISGFRFSDRTFEVKYKLGWFESIHDIDTQSSCDSIMHMTVDNHDAFEEATVDSHDEREVFEEVRIIIDDKKKFRVFLRIKEDIVIAFDAEELPILVGTRIKWKK